MQRVEGQVVSVHIEKTAGTSLQRLLCDTFGPDQVLVYNSESDTAIRASNPVLRKRTSEHGDHLRTLLAKLRLTPVAYHLALFMLRLDRERYAPHRLPKDWTAIHGHFKADKFDQWVPNPFYIAILREPLDRMISHYRYWKISGGAQNHRVNLPYSSAIGFEEFAFHPMNINYQTQALAGKALESFAALGTTENFNLFATQLASVARQMGYNDQTANNKLPYLNRSPKTNERGDLSLDQRFVSRFEECHADDYSNYDQALRLTNAG